MRPSSVCSGLFAELVRHERFERIRAALGFAHGFAIAFDQIEPKERACFLVAPKSQGDKLRESYRAGGGAPCLLAVTDASPAGTWALCADYARAIGCLRGGIATATIAIGIAIEIVDPSPLRSSWTRLLVQRFGRFSRKGAETAEAGAMSSLRTLRLCG